MEKRNYQHCAIAKTALVFVASTSQTFFLYCPCNVTSFLREGLVVDVIFAP